MIGRQRASTVTTTTKTKTKRRRRNPFNLGSATNQTTTGDRHMAMLCTARTARGCCCTSMALARPRVSALAFKMAKFCARMAKFARIGGVDPLVAIASHAPRIIRSCAPAGTTAAAASTSAAARTAPPRAAQARARAPLPPPPAWFQRGPSVGSTTTGARLPRSSVAASPAARHRAASTARARG